MCLFFCLLSSDFSSPLFAKITHQNNPLDSSFKSLQGEGSLLWAMVQHPSDHAHLDSFEKTYNRVLDQLKQPTHQPRISRIIHFIWLGPKNFPLQSIENIRHWKQFHPNYEFKFWTDRPRMAPISGMNICYVDAFHFESLKPYYEESDNWAEKSDILRFEILNQQGGIYVDHDADCLQSFDDLVQHLDFFAALEAPHDPIDHMALTVGIGIVASKTRHPLIRQTIDLISSRWEEETKRFDAFDAQSRAERVTHRTYIPITYSAIDYFKTVRDCDVIFPSQYFYPSKYQNEFLYSKHYYGTSWNHLGEKTKAKEFYMMLSPLFKYEARVFRILVVFSFLTLLLTIFFLFQSRFIIRGMNNEK